MKWWRILGWVCVLGCMVSCQREPSARFKKIEAWKHADGQLKVLSTIAMIEDLVKQIGGEHVASVALIEGELDPHTYQLVKGDDALFCEADLIFYSGLGLEHGPSLHQYLQQSDKAFSVAEEIARQNPEGVIWIHGQPDPHIWMDIELWASSIPFLTEKLCQKDPNHRQTFIVNARKLLHDMQGYHEEALLALQAIPSAERYLVTSHDAFHYFAKAYLADPEEQTSSLWKHRAMAPEGLAPESQLSACDIRAVVDYVHEHKVPVVFPESNVNLDSLKKILQVAKEEGLTVRLAQESLYGDAMGEAGSSGDSYLKMMAHNVRTIQKELQSR